MYVPQRTFYNWEGLQETVTLASTWEAGWSPIFLNQKVGEKSKQDIGKGKRRKVKRLSY